MRWFRFAGILLWRYEPLYVFDLVNVCKSFSLLSSFPLQHCKNIKPSKHNLFLLDTLCYYLRCGSHHVKLPLYSVKVKPSGHTALIRVLQKCPFYGWNDYDVYLIVEKYRDSKQSYRLKAALCIPGLTTVFLLRWPVPHLKATQWWMRCLCLVWTQTFPNLNTSKKNPQKVGFSLFTLACFCSTPCHKASPIFFTVQFAARGKKPSGHGASLSISYARVRPSSVLFPQQRGFF